MSDYQDRRFRPKGKDCRSRTRISGLALTVAAWAAAIGGCGGEQSTLDPESPAAREIATVWWWMLVIASVAFAGAVGMLGLSWVRRRRRGLPLIGRGAGRNLALVVIFGIVVPATVNVGLSSSPTSS